MSPLAHLRGLLPLLKKSLVRLAIAASQRLDNHIVILLLVIGNPRDAFNVLDEILEDVQARRELDHDGEGSLRQW